MSLGSTFTSRVLRKLKVFIIYDYYLFLFQFLERKIISLIGLNKKSVKVFFPYYSQLTHPEFLIRFYKNAPQHYFNLKPSQIVHSIQYANSGLNYLKKKNIIEPHDNILTIGGSLGFFEPREVVKHCKDISDYISSSKVSKILLGDNELVNHAKFYFSEDALKKIVIYPEMACIPVATKNSLIKKNEKLIISDKIKYLSIASSYKIKGVELLLKAFDESQIKGNLTLVCYDIPDDIEKKILKNNNISLIKNTLLTEKMKHQLYLDADVYINTTYIDGFFVASRALHYGLPIISNEYHRGKLLVKNNNGILLNEPMKYYEPKRYGVDWNNFEEYLEQVNLLIMKGGYDSFIQQLINAFKYYEFNPANILKDGIKSLELAEENSLTKSNEALKEIYKSVAAEIV